MTYGSAIRRAPLGDFEHQVILAVKEMGEDAYGSKIAERFLEKFSENIAVAQVYVTLQRPEKKGFVSSHFDQPRSNQGGRARRIFKLEAAKLRVLEESIAYRKELLNSRPTEGSRSKARNPSQDERLQGGQEGLTTSPA